MTRRTKDNKVFIIQIKYACQNYKNKKNKKKKAGGKADTISHMKLNHIIYYSSTITKENKKRQKHVSLPIAFQGDFMVAAPSH